LDTLYLIENRIDDITPLRELHNNGGLQSGSILDITNNDMNLKPDTDNYKTVKVLLNDGVEVNYIYGNITK
jgi:hypothetical protein